MKSLLLVRHAKSSWDFDTTDFDRPLNHRGEKDAPAMAKKIKLNGVAIDAFVSSPAKRAVTTARHFAEVYGAKNSVTEVPYLYEPMMESFSIVIENLKDENNAVAIFSHNPGITHFVNSLTSTQIPDMPTCATFAIKVDVESWKDFAEGKKEFWFMDYPKAG